MFYEVPMTDVSIKEDVALWKMKVLKYGKLNIFVTADLVSQQTCEVTAESKYLHVHAPVGNGNTGSASWFSLSQ